MKYTADTVIVPQTGMTVAGFEALCMENMETMVALKRYLLSVWPADSISGLALVSEVVELALKESKSMLNPKKSVWEKSVYDFLKSANPKKQIGVFCKIGGKRYVRPSWAGYSPVLMPDAWSLLKVLEGRGEALLSPVQIYGAFQSLSDEGVLFLNEDGSFHVNQGLVSVIIAESPIEEAEVMVDTGDWSSEDMLEMLKVHIPAMREEELLFRQLTCKVAEHEILAGQQKERLCQADELQKQISAGKEDLSRRKNEIEGIQTQTEGFRKYFPGQ